MAQIFSVIALLAIISSVLKFFQEYYSDKAATLAVNDIRRQLYGAGRDVVLRHFNLSGTSDVTSRLVQDSFALEQGFKTVLGQSIQQPIIAAMAFAVALWTNWRLTLVIVVFAAVMAVAIQKFGKKMRRASRAALQKSSAMLGQIQASINGIRVVKGASAERFERRRYGRIMARLVDEQLRMARLDAFSGPTIETLAFFVVACIVLFASYMVLVRHSLDPTSFILVMACLGGIGDSLRRLSKVNNVLQKGNAAAARIFEVLDLPIEHERRVADTARKALLKIPPIQREIRFESVSFSYPNSSSLALNDVSLHVPKGQSVAVVGRNGSGKTTLLALLPRFYDPQKGRVMIDGVDVRDVTLPSLRRAIGVVAQDPFLFSDTVRANIAFGAADATDEDVESAARHAQAHEFIERLPDGYDTVIGERGITLSGGQRQRIAIARALVVDPRILILDDATASVDATTEAKIRLGLREAMQNRTTLIIAHRLSTIALADEIVVLDRGRIAARGTHDELLDTSSVYRDIYEHGLLERQFADAVEARAIEEVA